MSVITATQRTIEGYVVNVYYRYLRGVRQPVIIWGGGTMCWRGWYQWVGELARRGYIVIEYSQSPYMSKEPQDWLKIVDDIMASTRNMPRIARIANHECFIIGGHSMGGTVALLVEDLLDVVFANLIFCPGYPTNPGGEYIAEASYNVKVPTLIVGAELDGITGVDAARKHFEQIPIDEKRFIEEKCANHLHYIDPGFVASAVDVFTTLGLVDNKACIEHEIQIDRALDHMLMFLDEYVPVKL